MADNEKQSEVNSKYDELKKVLGDASRIKTDINSNFKESLKTIKNDFSTFMLDNMDEEFKSIAERLGLFNGFADIEDKKKREKKIESACKSFFGKAFKKVSDFEYTKKGGKPKENTPPKCDTYVADLIASLYVGRLIPEVAHALSNAGIEIKFTKPITKLDLNNDDDKKVIVDYITRGANIQNDIFEKNAEIDDVIFENIPEDMKYDADSNPKGIKKAQFNALADLQAKTDDMSMNGDAEKASDIVEKQCDKHFENSKNQEMLAIVTELILAKQNEQDNDSKPDGTVSLDEVSTVVEEEEEEEEDDGESNIENGVSEEEEEEEENLDNLVPGDMD